jgi:YtkA-like protein
MNRPSRVCTSGFIVTIMAMISACGRGVDPASLTELQRVRSGELEVVLLSPNDTLRRGKDAFTIEFHAVSDGRLVDVGNVRATASMPMPGMPMFGSIDVQRSSVPGRYAANGSFEMAGTWRLTVEWDAGERPGSVSFSGSVQ